jgi:Lon protease-like protein
MANLPTDIAMLPANIPVFPLAGALLLPRGRLPLNIFEPRYTAMIENVLRSKQRLIGMIQPVPGADEKDPSPNLQKIGCAGRITGFQETEDKRYLISLTGACRFDVSEELETITPYRQVAADYERFAGDLAPAKDSDQINRTRLLELVRQYLDVNKMQADWKMIDATGGEELVNFLSMISPFGGREKQALLEAQTCVERTEVLIALVEMILADPKGGAATPLQ